METATRFTRELLEVIPEGDDLNALVSELMEPRPVAALLGLLREGKDWGYSHEPLQSPGGWWECNIGTDAGGGDEKCAWYAHREPSAEIADAWPIMERLLNEWPDCGLHRETEANKELIAVYFGFDGHGWTVVHGETAPLAICRAALIAATPA